MRFDCLVIYKHSLPVNQTLLPSNERVSLRYCIHWKFFMMDFGLHSMNQGSRKEYTANSEGSTFTLVSESIDSLDDFMAG